MIRSIGNAVGSPFRALLITALSLAVILLAASLFGPSAISTPYGAFLEANSAILTWVTAIVIFLMAYTGWRPLKALTGAVSRRSDGDRGRLIINVGLSVVVMLVVVALVTSLYQSMSGTPGAPGNFWRDPQVIAVAIGIILSVLFVDRWRSLEGKVDNLASDQSSRLKDIQQFTLDHIELKVGQVVDKAEKVSAKLASIAEQNPWLEVVTERDIIVETESLRGILRSSYNLLNEDKTLHLFEYLDFCSRKGTHLDPRGEKRPLRGTADDFLEVAAFCEIWLGDYALSAEFLRRFLDQAGSAAYTMYPDYLRRLLRIGNLPGARDQMSLLERVFQRQQLQKLLPFLDVRYPISERYRWHACNALALGHAAIGKPRMVERFATEAKASPYAERFAAEQRLFDAERLCYLQFFPEALKLLDEEEEEDETETTVYNLRDRIVVFERLGEFKRAAELRQRIDGAREWARGDDWLNSRPAPGKKGTRRAARAADRGDAGRRKTGSTRAAKHREPNESDASKAPRGKRAAGRKMAGASRTSKVEADRSRP